ncbi:MAG: hypothetical protein Q4B26_18130 [Eubacteriales bacterium]|nr:hypothetical protein [Eubacteriales bacterium]
MDIIENWMLMNNRMKAAHPDLIEELMNIHMECFNELRKSGYLISTDGKTIDQIAATLDPNGRLQLAGEVGRSLIKADGSLTEKSFQINLADEFSCCIFMALSAIFENLEGLYDETRYGKMKITLAYQSVSEEDPFGKKLPLLLQCFQWVEFKNIQRKVVEKKEAKPSPVRSLKDASVLVRVIGGTKIDTMREVFSGELQRGRVSKGDILYVLDQNGHELGRPGTVLLIAVNGKVVTQVESESKIDELLLTTELSPGDYDSIWLAGYQESSSQKNESGNQEQGVPNRKKGLFSRLFGR